MKNASRNKFFLCFRPIDIESEPVDCSSDRVLSYISVADKDDMIKENKNKHKEPTSALDRTPRSRRSFSGVVKAVLFETSLSKRVRERKQHRKRRHRSDSDLSDERLESNRRQRKRPHKSHGDISDQKFKVQSSEILPINEENQVISLRNQLASISSTSEKSDCVREGKKWDGLNPIDKERNSIRSSRKSTGLNHVVYLIVFSLWVTVFWGKMWAVLMTTFWIYTDQFWRNSRREKVREGESHEGSNTGRRKHLQQSGFREH
ncbi:hypothetical protein Ancab_007913 [Ancistrocladus abbreviatus]